MKHTTLKPAAISRPGRPMIATQMPCGAISLCIARTLNNPSDLTEPLRLEGLLEVKSIAGVEARSEIHNKSR